MQDYTNTDPRVWGPHYWYVIHSYAETFPENPSELDKDIASNFIKFIPFLLPCESCSQDAFLYIKNNYDNIPLIVKNKKNLVHFFKTFHDDVNKKLGKPSFYFPFNK